MVIKLGLNFVCFNILYIFILKVLMVGWVFFVLFKVKYCLFFCVFWKVGRGKIIWEIGVKLFLIKILFINWKVWCIWGKLIFNFLFIFKYWEFCFENKVIILFWGLILVFL